MPHARASGTSWSGAARLSARRPWLAILFVASGIPLALLAQTQSGEPPEEQEEFQEAPGAPTPNVHVALHRDEPLVAERTVVWTAAFQAAWDALAGALGFEDGIPLGPPARPEDLRSLNDGRLAPGTVHAADLTVIAGPATEETWARIEHASDLGRPEAAPEPHVRDLVAFARLRASVRYEVPFYVEEKPVLFGPRKVPVRAYGLRRDARGRVADQMREQVKLHLPGPAYGDDVARRGVVVLTGKDGKRVVISGRPPGATLRATWADAAAVLADTPARAFKFVDHLAIPRVAIVAGRSYDELVRAPILGIPDAYLAVARQDVALTVDERGADVDAEAVLVAVMSVPLRLIIDGPFLVALLAPGSDTPYVLAWIGTEDALTGWGEPVGRPLLAAEARPFVGSWTLDPDASAKAIFASWEKVGEPPDERAKRGLLEWMRQRRLDLVVQEHGAVEARVKDWPSAARTLAGALQRDGARVLLVLPGPPGDEDDEEPAQDEDRTGAAEQRWTVRRDGDSLSLRAAAGYALILRRR